MPIPELNTHGLLPPGVHDCTVEEITERFGAFQGGEQRPRLMEKLIAFAAEARASGIVRALLVDGSLVHIELQATNDPDMGYRMLMYYVLITQKYRRPLRQFVLYVRMVLSLSLSPFPFPFPSLSPFRYSE